jgi:hypothetical protein
MIEMPHEVNRSDLQKVRSKNFKIPGEPLLRTVGGEGDRSNYRKVADSDATSR